jgi:hypothetical protein
MCTKFADTGDEGIEKQCFSIFDTLSPAVATSMGERMLDIDSDRNQICPGGHRQEARRLSPDLHCGQQHFREVTQKTYIDFADWWSFPES